MAGFHGLDHRLRLAPARRRLPGPAALSGRTTRAAARAAALGQLLLAAAPAGAFVLDDVLDNGTADVADDGRAAARWSAEAGSLAETGARGLGGGLEYAVAPDFCRRLLPRFLDRPSCDVLRREIARTFKVWAEADPLIRFVDVTGRVPVALSPPDERALGAPEGAEFDLFALTPAEYAPLAGFVGWTQFVTRFADPVLADGRATPGDRLSSVDLVIDAERCYHLDPAHAWRGCEHFATLLLHEIGHGFGLDHPDEFPKRNFALAGPVDCAAPAAALRRVPPADRSAVMNSWFGLVEPLVVALSADEAAALAFLYPAC